jgi:hypothetical protein
MTSTCIDCGRANLPRPRSGELYMVHDAVWKQADMLPDGGSLCIACLEARLGRRLCRADFTDAPCNQPNHPFHTPRLRARLTTKFERTGRPRPANCERAPDDPGPGWLRSRFMGWAWPRPGVVACGRASCLVCAPQASEKFECTPIVGKALERVMPNGKPLGEVEGEMKLAVRGRR